MKPRHNILLKMAIGLAVAGVLPHAWAVMAVGGPHPFANIVFAVCEFTALTSVLIILLTLRPISLIKVAIGLAIEGVLAFAFLMLGGGSPPHGWLIPTASGLFAIFEIAALTCVVIVLINVSKEPRNPRAAKAAKVILQLFFPFTGLIVGGFCGGLFFAWLFCALWGTGSHMDMCGLAGLFLGMWPGAIGGLLTGQWLGIRFGK